MYHANYASALVERIFKVGCFMMQSHLSEALFNMIKMLLFLKCNLRLLLYI